MGSYDAHPKAEELNNGFAVLVRITAKKGEADAVARILESLVEPSMSEPGLKYFIPYRSADDPSQFFVYELYEDASGWDAHNASPHFLAAVDALVEKAAQRERIPFVPFVK
jgi:quinol monooxygenase YgiN